MKQREKVHKMVREARGGWEKKMMEWVRLDRGGLMWRNIWELSGKKGKEVFLYEEGKISIEQG